MQTVFEVDFAGTFGVRALPAQTEMKKMRVLEN